MSVVGTVVANLIANTEPFSKGIKKAESDLARLQKGVAGIGRSVKVGLSFALGSSIKKVVKQTLKDAQDANSALFKGMDKGTVESLVADANALADAFDRVGDAVKRITFSGLQEASPTLQSLARQLEFFAQLVGGENNARNRIFVNNAATPPGLNNVADIQARMKAIQAAKQKEVDTISGAASDLQGNPLNPLNWLRTAPLTNVSAQRDAQIRLRGLRIEETFLLNRLKQIRSGDSDFPGDPNRLFMRKGAVADWAQGLIDQGRNVPGRVRQFGRDALFGVQTNPTFRAVSRSLEMLMDRFEEFQHRVDELSASARDASRGAFGQFTGDIAALRAGVLRGDINEGQLDFGALDAAKRLQQALGIDGSNPGLAQVGTQDFLRAVHQKPEPSIKELVGIAKQQLTEQQQAAKKIGKEVASALKPEEVHF